MLELRSTVSVRCRMGAMPNQRGLEDLLGCKVDVVTANGRHVLAAPRVLTGAATSGAATRIPIVPVFGMTRRSRSAAPRTRRFHLFERQCGGFPRKASHLRRVGLQRPKY